MPTIEVSFRDLCSLVGQQLKKDELADIMLYAKVEIDDVKGDLMKLDCKDTNRPDLWCTEGIAREIKMRLGKKNDYKILEGKHKVIINTKSPVQPFAVNMIIRDIEITEDVLSQMIQLQDKLSLVIGVGRKEMCMGMYDLEKVKFPVKYTSLHASEIKFMPLGFNKEMYAEEIMLMHPKGKEFSHILKDVDGYPVWIDAEGKILSVVPIINSNEAGNVSTKTKNLFVECTGNNMGLLKTAINMLAAQAIDRRGKVETVTAVSKKSKIVTPNLQNKNFCADINYLRSISGMPLKDKEIIRLLEMSGYYVKQNKNKLLLTYPAYRNDIMHQRDIAEDILISYGYNSIKPLEIKIATRARLDELEEFCETLSEIMIGVGLQEILSYTLTNKDNIFKKMNLPEQQIAEIENPSSANWSVFRTSIIPNLLEFFAVNKHVEYPQNIFEIGKCIFLSGGETKSKDVKYLAAAISNYVATYEMIAQIVDVLFRNLGVKYQLKIASHSSFITGRSAEIFVNGKKLGVLGEVYPQVLNNWNLEKPVVVMEIDATELFYLL